MTIPKQVSCLRFEITLNNSQMDEGLEKVLEVIGQPAIPSHPSFQYRK